MSAARYRDPDEKLVLLAEAYCDDTLSDDQWKELERRLLTNSQARAYFRRHLALDAALRDHGDSNAEDWLATSDPPGRSLGGSADEAIFRSTGQHSSRRLPLWAASLAGAAALIVAVLGLFGRAPVDARPIASIERLTGDVRLVASDGLARLVGAGAVVRAGDTVRTSGTGSSVVVAYADDTRLTMVGNTAVTCGGTPNKSVVIHHGTLAASVAPQPPEAPMVLATPTARVEVLGTRFLIEAAARRTELSVTEGRVRLVRVRDGEMADVADGMRAIVTERMKLLVEESPPLPTTWEVDFEAGLPAGWKVGEFIAQGLPTGSRGAVRAERHEGDDGATYYMIDSESAWSHGLFAVGKGSHLHMTFKMDQPNWLNLFLGTRNGDPRNPQFGGNFIFKDFPKIAPGQWLTMTVPLARFRKLYDGPETIDELVPFHVFLNSTGPDRGLVIDRLWVTPDGPGEVRIEEVK